MGTVSMILVGLRLDVVVLVSVKESKVSCTPKMSYNMSQHASMCPCREHCIPRYGSGNGRNVWTRNIY